MTVRIVQQNKTINIREQYNLKELILYSDGYVSLEGCVTAEDLLELAQRIYDLANGTKSNVSD